MAKHKRPSPGQYLAAFLQDHARSIMGLLLITVMGASLTLGVQWLQDPYRFPLRVVKVEGDFRYLQHEGLQQAVAPHIEGGFFTADVAVIRNAVENLPWVYRATVQRVWPDRLRVHIEEQVPVARWGEDGFLNRFGESFIPEWMPAGIELPRLSGPQGHEQTVLKEYRLVVRALAPLGLRVARVRLDERRAWSIETGNGVQLELGRAAAYERLQRFVRSYPAVFAGRLEELQRVDLRYSNGFSVYWQQAVTDADTEKTDKAKG